MTDHLAKITDVDHRELIAQAIYHSDTGHEGEWNQESVGRKLHYRQLADAVLAALGDRLIPEGWYLVHIHRHNGGYRAVLDNTLDIESKKVGTGPTWYDALIAASQKAQEADR